MHNDYELFEAEEEEKSKSQIKREFAELQRLGEQLVALKPAQIPTFSFSQAMLDALDEYTRIKNRTAQQRHIRRIGKLLADEDVLFIRQNLERLSANHPEEKRRVKLLEQWRDRLIADGDSALNHLASICSELDRHYLRQLIRAAQKERESQKTPSAAKKIFAYLKTVELSG